MTMPLSTAIRLGSMLGHQCFERYTDPEGGACAMGAAGLAIGLTVSRFSELPEEWQDFMRDVLDPMDCPCCGLTQELRYKAPNPKLLSSLVPHLNDNHKWTRERIANFIQLQERRIAAGTMERTRHEAF